MQNELKVMLTAGSGGESQQCHKRGDFSLLFSKEKMAYRSTARNCRVPDHCWH